MGSTQIVDYTVLSMRLPPRTAKTVLEKIEGGSDFSKPPFTVKFYAEESILLNDGFFYLPPK